MQVTVQSTNLVKALKLAAPVRGKGTLFEGVLFEATSTERVLRLRGANGFQAVKVAIPAICTEGGSHMVERTVVQRIAKVLGKGEIELTLVGDTKHTSITVTSSETQVTAESTNPPIPEEPQVSPGLLPSISLDWQVFQRKLRYIAESISEMNTRPTLCGANMEVQDIQDERGTVTFTGTDGYILSHAGMEITSGLAPGGMGAIIPVEAIYQLIKIGKDMKLKDYADNPMVKVSWLSSSHSPGAPEYVWFDMTFLTMSCSVMVVPVKGKFPDYQMLIPDTVDPDFVPLTLDANLFLNRVEQVGSKDNPIVRIRGDQASGTVMLSSKGDMGGNMEVSADMPAGVPEDRSIALGFKYLQQVLPLYQGQQVSLFISGDPKHTKPVLFQGEGEADCHVLMPMFVQW